MPGGSAGQIDFYIISFCCAFAEERLRCGKDQNTGGLRFAECDAAAGAVTRVHGRGVIIDKDEVQRDILLHRLKVFQRVGNGISVQLRLFPNLVITGVVYSALIGSVSTGGIVEILNNGRQIKPIGCDLVDHIPVHDVFISGQRASRFSDIVSHISMPVIDNRIVNRRIRRQTRHAGRAVRIAGIRQQVGNTVRDHMAAGTFCYRLA